MHTGAVAIWLQLLLGGWCVGQVPPPPPLPAQPGAWGLPDVAPAVTLGGPTTITPAQMTVPVPPAAPVPVPPAAPVPAPFDQPPPPVPPPPGVLLPPPPPPGNATVPADPWGRPINQVFEPVPDYPPGFFGAIEVTIVAPELRGLSSGIVQSGFTGARVVSLPAATLNATAAPRVVFGYRSFAGNEYYLGYRFLGSEGSQAVAVRGGREPAQLNTQLDVNVIDLGFTHRPYRVLPELGWQWGAGARIGIFDYESRAFSFFYDQSVRSNFVGAGPFGNLALSYELTPRLALVSKLDYGLLFGSISQRFNEAFAYRGTILSSGETRVSGSQTVQVLTVQTGFDWAPLSLQGAHFQFGYQFEQWWDVGRLNFSGADLTTHGAYLRLRFDF
jgi:hypothetical protein